MKNRLLKTTLFIVLILAFTSGVCFALKPSDNKSHSTSSLKIKLESPKPNRPTLTGPIDIDTDGKYYLGWSNESASGAIWYELQEDTSSSFSNPTRYLPFNNQQYIHSKEDDLYYYRVRAWNEDGIAGNFSNTVDVSISLAALSGDFLTIKDGYFYNPKEQDHWLPHGIAYQTWNRPLGVWQTHKQIEYDLAEMEKAHVNSIRVDFVWKHIEEAGDNQFNWTNYDYLLETAARHNIKVFALIGYQWPPDWFPGTPGEEGADPGWYTMHPPGFDSDGLYHAERWTSDIISFEDPDARAQYTEFLRAVTNRYKDNPTIAAWIVGNEYGYLGLWSIKQDGYDPECENAFRSWLSDYYSNDISALNSAWGKTYASFSEVVMPAPYDRDNPAWWDLVQWREESAAGFLAIGAKAVKEQDPNHLISYSTVGMQWGEEDWRYHAEDPEKIAKACENIGAPLDFWSINNYPWGLSGHESQTGQWGVVNAKWKTRLPVLYTETGFTSSETIFPGMNPERQATLLRNSLWEALETGAIGVHVFHWHDREYISKREKGFGIVYPDRRVKPAYWMVRDTYNLMDQNEIIHLLVNSQSPTPDVAFLWTDAVDSMYNRYECNMQQLYGPLERLGLEPTFINYRQLLAGEYKKYKAIILPRNMRTHQDLLTFIRSKVLRAGVNIYADADLPGEQDYHVESLTDFVFEVKKIFGIDATDTSGYESPLVNEEYGIQFEPIEISVQEDLAPLTTGRVDTFCVWKYSNATEAVSGDTIATHPNGKPALQIKKHPKAKAAITTFSLGDQCPDGDGDGEPDTLPWARRYDWLSAIFLNSFGINPVIDLSGSQFVLADYRICQDGSVLLSFKNYKNDSTEIVTLTTDLIIGKTVQSLTEGDVIEENSDGTITISLDPDGHRLLYAYSGSPEAKIIITNARATVHPLGNDSYPVKVWYDTQGATLDLEVTFQEDGDNGDGTPNEVYSQVSISVTGSGEQELWVWIPDANQADSDYISTPEGGSYKFSAYLKDGQNIISSASYTTQLEWGIKIEMTPTSLEQGETYTLELSWEDLYEYLWWETTPLSRETAFPGRVLVYKSTKTQAQFPGHFGKFNQVCVWLESLGYTQAELGIREPTKGYYILTDTDLGDDSQPLNLNWGYLKEFYSVLILPGVYVMNDAECNNVTQYLQNGLFTVIATDGGVGIRKEDGSSGIGRIESVFGVGSDYINLSNIGELTVTENDHYITHDYQKGTILAANPSTEATGWTSSYNGQTIATVSDGSNVAPAIICNSYGEGKAFTFNFGIDTFNQLTANFDLLAQRVFEWATREAYKLKVQLKYPTSNPYDEDIIIAEEIIWVLDGTGTVTIDFKIPRNSMTGDNLIWTAYIYPQDAEDPWAEQKGFYTSENDPGYENTTLSGFGLQITGVASTIYGGRMWDLWVAYNTQGETLTLNYGLTDNSYEETIFIYYDADYPVSATTHSAASALANDLVSKFNDKGIDALIINATEWQQICQTQRKVWVINLMGVAPDTIWNGTYYSLIEEWLDSGGKVLWLGEWEFYYIGHSDGTTETTGEAGSQLVFDFQPTGTYDNRMMSPTELGSAFIPSITSFISHRGASIETIAAHTQTYEVYAKSADNIADPCLFNVEDGYFVKFHMSSYVDSDVLELCEQISEYILNRGPDYGEKIFWQAQETVIGEEGAVRFDPWAPDYDAEILEYISSQDGGKYEWSVWFSEQPNRYNSSTELFWAPRLKVEDANFPRQVAPNETLSLPLEWEDLPEVPVNLNIMFQDPYTGITYVDETFVLNELSGEDNFSITIPASTPYGKNYLWAAYTYPLGSLEPFNTRYGLDDTFRFDDQGLALEPETEIEVSSGINLSFTAPSVFEKSIRRDFNLGFVWDSLKSGRIYKLFYILIEADTGNYKAASWDYDTGGLWEGDTYVIDNTDGSRSDGSYATTKDLRPYAYDNFLWVAEIRDESDNLLMQETIEATTIKGGISGQVHLQGRSDYSNQITFELRNPGETVAITTYQINTDQDGAYTLSHIEPGTYDLTAKASNYLRERQESVSVTGGQLSPDIYFNLLGGDANDDNYIDLKDEEILRNAYNSQEGDSNWDRRADFNGDGFIGWQDSGILRANYNLKGDDGETSSTESLFSLYDPGTEFPVNYNNYGSFYNVGTSNYYYDMTNTQGLSSAVGEGIYPNANSIYQDPEYQRYLAEGRLEGSHWDFVNSGDPQADFYKWATAPESEGIRLFFMAIALVDAELIEHAIKTYYAIVVHFPETPAWDPLAGSYWYVGPAAADMISVLCRDYPDLELKLIDCSVEVENGGDLDLFNDIVTVTPGSFITYTRDDRVQEIVNISQLDIVETRGTGKVQLVQYSNGQWQLKVEGEPFIIKGLSYSPTKVGMDMEDEPSWQFLDENTNGKIDAPYEAWADKNGNNYQDFDELSVGDFQLLKELGCNAIRLFHSAGSDNITYLPDDYNKELLRDMYQTYGIGVIMGDFLGAYTIGSGATWAEGTDYTDIQQREKMKNVVREMVLDHKDEPYVLLWLLGNENNMEADYTGINATRTNASVYPQEYAEFLNEVAIMIHNLDPDHPVAVGNFGLGLVEYYAQYAPELDILGTNWYSGKSGVGLSYLLEAKEKFDRPIFFPEYGCDAYHYQEGVNEEEQAEYHEGNWESIRYGTYGNPGPGNVIGGVIFGWLDEWWKDNVSGDSKFNHQTDPQFYWGILPDRWSHEEWYGICGQGDGSQSPFLRELREAYHSYKKMWAVPISQDPISKDITLSWGSYPGLNYDVYYSDDNVTWILAQGDIGASGLSSTSWIDDGTYTGIHPKDVALRYYRVAINGTDPIFYVLRVNACGRISGRVLLEGRTDHSETISFELRSPGQTTPLQTYNVVTNSEGSFTLEGIEPGVYDLAAKSSKCLRQVQTNIEVYVAGQTPSVDFDLLGGDANDDNFIAWEDYGILRGAYGSAIGDANWDERADFTNDGYVSWEDYGILRTNYGLQGDN